jgi:hypothetical protein
MVRSAYIASVPSPVLFYEWWEAEQDVRPEDVGEDTAGRREDNWRMGENGNLRSGNGCLLRSTGRGGSEATRNGFKK